MGRERGVMLDVRVLPANNVTTCAAQRKVGSTTLGTGETWTGEMANVVSTGDIETTEQVGEM